MAQSTSEPTTGSRLAALDTIRCIAIVLVLFRHMGLPPLKATASVTSQFLYLMQMGGWVGVDLFFVLSGFLVSGLLFRQQRILGRINVFEFLVRRGFKIYPAFWVMVGSTFIVRFFLGDPAANQHLGRDLMRELLFYQNYYQGLHGHTWSLGVEEHFYLLLALILGIWSWARATTPEGRFRGLTVFCCAAILGITALRFATVARYGTVRLELMMWSHYRFDGFFVGVLLSQWYQADTERFLKLCRQIRWPAILLGCGLLFPCYIADIDRDLPAPWAAQLGLTWDRTWMFQYGFICNYVAGALWLMAALGFSSKRNRVGLLSWIGKHSYGIYLWHIPLGFYGLRVVMRAFEIKASALTVCAWYFGISIVMGIVLTWIIEQPALWLRDLVCPDSASKRSGKPSAIPSATPPAVGPAASPAAGQLPQPA